MSIWRLLDLLNTYNGLLNVSATTLLVLITYLYLRETRKIREANQHLLRSENCLLDLELGQIQTDSESKRLWFELRIRNIGSKPARHLTFKLLTKRSPRECISHLVCPYPRVEFLKSKDQYTTYRKDYTGLMPGNEVIFYCEVSPSFLDYDRSFYLWLKYADFYGINGDEIRHVTIDGEGLKTVFNVNVGLQYNKKLSIPVTYY